MPNLTHAQSARIKIANQQIRNIIYGSHRDIIEGVQIDGSSLKGVGKSEFGAG